MDQLDKLKNKLATNLDNRSIAVSTIEKEEIAISENEKKLQNKVSILLEKERLEVESYKELVIGSVDRLNNQMKINNEKIGQLGDSLSDMNDLKRLYEEKNKIMSKTHEELKKALKSEEKDLREQNMKLTKEITQKEEEYKDLSFKNSFKKQFENILAIILVTFIAVLIGSWLGLGFVEKIRKIFI